MWTSQQGVGDHAKKAAQYFEELTIQYTCYIDTGQIIHDLVNIYYSYYQYYTDMKVTTFHFCGLHLYHIIVTVFRIEQQSELTLIRDL